MVDSRQIDPLWSGAGATVGARQSWLFEFDERWRRVASLPLELDARIVALDGPAADDLWLVASGVPAGAPRLFHWNGTQFVGTDAPELLEPESGGSRQRLRDVQVDEAGDVWVVGRWEGGQILRGVAGRWSVEPHPEAEKLEWLSQGPAGLYAAGEGDVLRRSEAGWERVPWQAGEITDLQVLGSAVFVLESTTGGEGSVHRLTDDGWQLVAGLPTRDWRSITGTGPQDVWVAGYHQRSEPGGGLAHY